MALFPLTVYVALIPSTVTPVTVCTCSAPLYVSAAPSVTVAPAMLFCATVNCFVAVPMKLPVPVTVRVYVPALVALLPLTVYVASSPSTGTPATTCACSAPLYVSDAPSVTVAPAMFFRATVNCFVTVPVKCPVPVTVSVYDPALVALFPLTVHVASSPSTFTPATVCTCSAPLYASAVPSVIDAPAMLLRVIVYCLVAVPVKLPVPVTVSVYVPASVAELPETLKVALRPSTATDETLWLCAAPVYTSGLPRVTVAPAMLFRATVNCFVAVPVKLPVPVTVSV